MENFCECGIYENTFNELVSFFLKRYGNFLKIKGDNIKNKKSFQEMQDNYDVILSSIDGFTLKGEEAISKMNKCPNNHSESLEQIKNKLDKKEDLLNRVKRHYENIKNTIPEMEEEEEENEINEEMSDKEIMENDKKTIIWIQNLLEDKEYKDKIRADKKEIIKIKNNLEDIVKEINAELVKNDEQIDNIENKVEKSYDLVEKGTDENLKKASKHALGKRRLKYQVGLTATLGAIGSIIPGIGTLLGAGIGGALGGLIGYGAYRIDKHRLKKIEKYEKQIQEEKEKKQQKK